MRDGGEYSVNIYLEREKEAATLRCQKSSGKFIRRTLGEKLRESAVASCKRGDSRERLLILNPYRAFENYQSSYHRRRAAYANCCGVERLNGKLLDSIFSSLPPSQLPSRLPSLFSRRKPVLSLR